MSFIDQYLDDRESHFTGLEWINSLKDRDILYLFGETSSFGDLYIPKNQDINKKHDIIFSGCSETHGDYLVEDSKSYSGEDIWGFKVAKYLDKSAVNLGLGGISAYDIVRNILSIVNEENKPSYIFCLFPDLNRLTLPNDPKRLIDNIYLRDEDIVTVLSTPITSDYLETKYSRAPHLKENVIPKIVPVWLNLKSIQVLEKFCSIAGIVLRYTTWSEQTHGFIEATSNLQKSKNIKDSYPNYVDSKPLSWHNKSKSFQCSANHLVDIDKNYRYFDMGKDGLHMGTHRHAHIAEAIIKSLTN